MDPHLIETHLVSTYEYAFWIMLALIAVGVSSTLGVLFWPRGHRPLAIKTMLSEADDKTSFARVTGALGALTLTALFVGVCMWAQFCLFFDRDLDKLTGLWPVFVLGTTLFTPYFANRITAALGAAPK